MSSPYPTLNNRPIDQWKVTELKEELRKRKLKTNGLKEELVRRLDEVLRSEVEEDEKEELGNGSYPDDDSDEKADEGESVPPPADNAEHVEEDESEPQPAENNAELVEEMSDNVENDAPMVDNIDSTNVKDDVDSSADVGVGMKDHDEKEVATATLDATVGDNSENTALLGNTAIDGQTGVGQSESGDRDTRHDESNRDTKHAAQDAAHTDSTPANQVSEVRTDLGLKSESISTDSMSIIEKNELKDNLNANNVNLELEVVKPEMVQPSSSDVATIAGDHPLEDDKDLVDNQSSLEEAGGDTCPTDMELCKKVEGGDGVSPEKLNLDRSSGDESMEEDVLEGKQIESKDSSELGERSEDIKEDSVQEKIPIKALAGGFSHEKNDMISEEEIKPTAAAEKRKAEDEEIVNKNEPKRQRRWNSDPVKPPELQASNLSTGMLKDAFQPPLRRPFTRSDSNVSGDGLKERIVPPSQKVATASLRIDRFLRPFTLKAVQELLAKTGTVSVFWMDHIKTHCYVTYSSVDEAIATRNALYNLQWPTNGGRMLVAEFVDPQEVKARVEGPPPQSPAPVTPSLTTPTLPPFQRPTQAAPPARTNSLRQHQQQQQEQLPPPPPLPLPPPPALSNPPPAARERLPPPPPLPLKKKPEPPPVMTLDDLFKKTKATPRIYYLPLSEEQVAAKLAAQSKQGREK